MNTTELPEALEASEVRQRVVDVVQRLRNAANRVAAELTCSGTLAAVAPVQRQHGRSPWIIPCEAWTLHVAGHLVAVGCESRLSPDATGGSVPVTCVPFRGMSGTSGLRVTPAGVGLPGEEVSPYGDFDPEAILCTLLRPFALSVRPERIP